MAACAASSSRSSSSSRARGARGRRRRRRARTRGETRARAGKMRRPRWRLGTRARARRRPNEMRKRRGDDRSRGAGASGEVRPRARARDAARTRTTRRWTWSRPAEGPMDVRSGARGCGQGGFRSATKAGTTSSEPRCPPPAIATNSARAARRENTRFFFQGSRTVAMCQLARQSVTPRVEYRRWVDWDASPRGRHNERRRAEGARRGR